MSGELPRDAAGGTVCEWCAGPMVQPAVGRRRRYCGRSCRELAYRERRTQRRIAEAVQALAPHVLVALVVAQVFAAQVAGSGPATAAPLSRG